jgi:tetratricopeptide (TPR) repeat protein
MNVLFCNIAWMKLYDGFSDDDKPKNGGSYVKENEYGHECFNFQDYNGKCYGFVMLNGDMALELHFKEAKKHSAFLKDVLVIWVATNDANETRIVGWYKNATVYREQQSLHAFTHENFDLFYSIEALAKDSHLLPEEARSFPIQRAAQAGTGTGMGRSNVWYAKSSFAQTVLIPKVIEYINNYNGKFANVVFTDAMLNKVIDERYKINDYQKLYEKGIKSYEYQDYLLALEFFNTARIIKETPEVDLYIANSLISLRCFDKVIPMFEKIIQSDENNVDAARNLLFCYDYIGNREKSIEYCKILLELLGDSEEGINEKIFISCVMFDIYVSLRDEKNASVMIDKFSSYFNDDKGKETVKQMNSIIKEEFDE